MVNNERRYWRDRLGRFIPSPVRGRVRTYARPGGWAPVRDYFGRKVPGEYEALPPSETQRVAELQHQSLERGRWWYRTWTKPCRHYGTGFSDEEALKSSFADYLAAHGDVDRAPSLIVAPG